MRPPKAAAEEHVDRRIHYNSNSEEGWVGRPSTPSYPETSADARALQRPSSGLIKLLLEMPDTHYKYSLYLVPTRNEQFPSECRYFADRISFLIVRTASLLTDQWSEGLAGSDFWS